MLGLLLRERDNSLSQSGYNCVVLCKDRGVREWAREEFGFRFGCYE